jgi:DNA-binding transcriptional MocR family regulator
MSHAISSLTIKPLHVRIFKHPFWSREPEHQTKQTHTKAYTYVPSFQKAITMVHITPFAVEQWMDEYETTPGVLNVAETCAASVSIDDLVAMSNGPAKNPIDTSTKLTYGAIPGSQTLRQRIAAHCSTEGLQLAAEDIIVTQGAIGANFLALYTLIGPGDHVICVYPTYQQLYDTPRSLGAEVTLWKLKKENGFVPDVDELAGLIKPNTKVCIIALHYYIYHEILT